MIFTPINLQDWPRGQMFYYFSEMAPTGYSLTVSVDVTRFRETLKAHGFKLFPAYLWLVTRELNHQKEFKIAKMDGVLGYFDTLTPLYASFHEDDKNFSLMWTEYEDDFSVFHQNYLNHQEQFGGKHGVLCQAPMVPPPNAYTVSCIPWVSFSHFAVHSYEKKDYYFPSVEMGKIYEQNHKLWMPLSLTCHHAATDGYHIHCFLEELQEDMNHFEKLIL